MQNVDTNQSFLKNVDPNVHLSFTIGNIHNKNEYVQISSLSYTVKDEFKNRIMLFVKNILNGGNNEYDMEFDLHIVSIVCKGDSFHMFGKMEGRNREALDDLLDLELRHKLDRLSENRPIELNSKKYNFKRIQMLNHQSISISCHVHDSVKEQFVKYIKEVFLSKLTKDKSIPYIDNVDVSTYNSLVVLTFRISYYEPKTAIDKLFSAIESIKTEELYIDKITNIEAKMEEFGNC